MESMTSAYFKPTFYFLTKAFFTLNSRKWTLHMILNSLQSQILQTMSTVRLKHNPKRKRFECYFCVMGNEFWSINSPTLSCRVWTTSWRMKTCVSSRSLRMNFFPRAIFSSRKRRNCFMAGSLVQWVKRILNKSLNFTTSFKND